VVPCCPGAEAASTTLPTAPGRPSSPTRWPGVPAEPVRSGWRRFVDGVQRAPSGLRPVSVRASAATSPATFVRSKRGHPRFRPGRRRYCCTAHRSRNRLGDSGTLGGRRLARSRRRDGQRAHCRVQRSVGGTATVVCVSPRYPHGAFPTGLPVPPDWRLIRVCVTSRRIRYAAL